MHGQIQRGGDRGSGTRLKNHKNIGFPSNIDPDRLKITKLPSQHSMVGHYQHASETPFQGRSAGWPTFSGISILCIPSSPPPPHPKKTQCWTPSDKTFWIRACSVNNTKYSTYKVLAGDFLPFSRCRISAQFPIENSHIFSQFRVCFSQLRKV